MLKNLVQLKDVIDGKELCLNCDNDSPLPVVKEFLFRCLKYIGNVEDNIKAQQDQAKADSDAAANKIVDPVVELPKSE